MTEESTAGETGTTGTAGETGTEEETDLNTEFNLEEDFKADPLIPAGNYFGNVIEVKMGDKGSVDWKVALDGNGGFRSDGETPVDGSHIYYRNWLPKKGDENIPTPSGNGNKFQAKVNMMKQFADGMKVNMNTMSIIRESITNGDWIGLQVVCKLAIAEYPKDSGKYKNDCNGMVAV